MDGPKHETERYFELSLTIILILLKTSLRLGFVTKGSSFVHFRFQYVRPEVIH